MTAVTIPLEPRVLCNTVYKELCGVKDFSDSERRMLASLIARGLWKAGWRRGAEAEMPVVGPGQEVLFK